MGAIGRARPGLPPELTSFVGRRGQVRQVVDLLERARLVTLTGPGGVGKTRLALRVAREVAASYEGGVVLVELAGIADPGKVAELVGAPGGERRLLLLDSCEHLVDACAALVADLLRAVPDLSVLATSRQPLSVQGEHLLVVAPLTLPSTDVADATLSRDVARQYEAVSLFVQRADAATGGFVLDTSTVGDVVRLCRRLDGLPLALELAAARLRVLSLPQLVDRLDDRFGLLSAGPRCGVGRQRSLQSTVAWSFDLCSPTEQRAWSLLAVLEGDFDLDAAEQACASVLAPSTSVLDVVAALVDKSVLRSHCDSAQVWYSMLETFRAYGLERSRRSGRVDDLTRRELEVAELVARGMTNRQIARALVISVRTAEGHVQRILDKIGASSRARIGSWLSETRRV
jgi:predicted ATPase